MFSQLLSVLTPLWLAVSRYLIAKAARPPQPYPRHLSLDGADIKLVFGMSLPLCGLIARWMSEEGGERQIVWCLLCWVHFGPQT